MGIVIVFIVINLRGAKDVAFWETLTVAIKFIVLSGLSITGICFLNPDLLSPDYYPPTNDVLFSLAITFFAYEGFRVITVVSVLVELLLQKVYQRKIHPRTPS